MAGQVQIGYMNAGGVPEPLSGQYGRLKTIDSAQAAVSEGRMFRHHKIYTVGIGATLRFLLNVPTDPVFLARVKTTNSGGPIVSKLSEGVAASNNGTPVSVYNANRTPESMLLSLLTTVHRANLCACKLSGWNNANLCLPVP